MKSMNVRKHEGDVLQTGAWIQDFHGCNFDRSLQNAVFEKTFCSTILIKKKKNNNITY